MTAFERGNLASSLDFVLRQELPPKSKILDIGCNQGSLVFNLKQKGYENVFGIDVNQQAIDQGKKSYSDIRARLSSYDGKELPFKANDFDVITMFDVIEHIPQVDDFLKAQVYCCLKPGGRFLFQTPNKYQNIIWEVINRRHPTKWKQYHISLQTVSSLTQILSQSGFTDIKLQKHQIITQHNLAKVQKKLGNIGVFMLHCADRLPLRLSTNIWGSASKPSKKQLSQ